MMLSALAEGLDLSAAERVFGYRQATITTWLTRAGKHAQTLHERCFRNLHLPHLQLDELRTRLRSATQVLWLWLAIDPLTKIVPVLHRLILEKVRPLACDRGEGQHGVNEEHSRWTRDAERGVFRRGAGHAGVRGQNWRGRTSGVFAVLNS